MLLKRSALKDAELFLSTLSAHDDSIYVLLHRSPARAEELHFGANIRSLEQALSLSERKKKGSSHCAV